jgi:hypothetical protein
VLREDRLGTAQADLRRARDTGRTGGVEVDVVGGITGLILGVLVTTQGRAVVLTWASVGLDLAYSLLIGSVVGRTPHSGPTQYRPPKPCAAHDQGTSVGPVIPGCGRMRSPFPGGGPVPKVVPTACSRQECHR